MTFIKNFRDATPPTTKYYVYFIYFKGRPSPVYVGKGQKDRYKHYYYYPEKVSNRILRRKLIDLKEQSKDYFIEFVYETDDEFDALCVEEFYIAYYGLVHNGTGILYNFESRGLMSATERPGRRCPVYIDGFVFDSVGRAMEKTGIKHDTLKKYTEIGRASYLEDEEQVERVFERERKLKYHFFYKRHKKAFRRAKKNMLISESRMGTKNWMYGRPTAISRKIEIDGKVFESLNGAAKHHNFSKGDSLRKYLERGNHEHTYRFLEEE